MQKQKITREDSKNVVFVKTPPFLYVLLLKIYVARSFALRTQLEAAAFYVSFKLAAGCATPFPDH